VNIHILGAPWLKDGKCLSSDGPLTVPLTHVNLFASRSVRGHLECTTYI